MVSEILSVTFFGSRIIPLRAVCRHQLYLLFRADRSGRGSAPAASRRKPRMAPMRLSMRVLATLTLWAGFGLSSAFAQLPPLTADKAFEVKPRQPGVSVPTPTPAEASRF